jgi:hypothetical protein
MTHAEASAVIRDVSATFQLHFLAAAALISSAQTTTDDLLICLRLKGLPAELAATTLYFRTGRAQVENIFVTDDDDWANYLRELRAG